MLSDTLTNIEALLKQLSLMNDSVLSDFISLLSHYKVGMWLYPGVVKRRLNLPIKEVYSVLNVLEHNGYIESYYELCCFGCQKTNGLVRTINEMPQTFTCEICEKELVAIENSVLIYRVNQE